MAATGRSFVLRCQNRACGAHRPRALPAVFASCDMRIRQGSFSLAVSQFPRYRLQVWAHPVLLAPERRGWAGLPRAGPGDVRVVHARAGRRSRPPHGPQPPLCRESVLEASNRRSFSADAEQPGHSFPCRSDRVRWHEVLRSQESCSTRDSSPRTFSHCHPQDDAHPQHLNPTMSTLYAALTSTYSSLTHFSIAGQVLPRFSCRCRTGKQRCQHQAGVHARFPRASFACLLLLCAPTPLLSAPRTSRLQLCFSSVVHVHVTFILHAISLEVAEDFVLALGASLLTALDLFIPDGNFRQHWRASHLLRMLRVTMSCYDIRRTLGPQQSQRELDVLTLSAHVLACVYAREDRVVTVGDCPLPPLVRMPFHQTFRLQVRAWGGAAWRPQLDVLHREVALVLDEVWQRRAIFEHTQGTLHLFLPWRAILEDLSLLVAGLLNHPSTVQDEL